MTIFGKQKAFPLIISFPSFAPPPSFGPTPFFGGAETNVFGARGCAAGAPPIFGPSLSAIERIFVRLFEGFWGADF